MSVMAKVVNYVFLSKLLNSLFGYSIRLVRFTICGIGGALLLFGLIVLTLIEQDDARHSFGHSGGMCYFILCCCPFFLKKKICLVWKRVVV